MLNVNFANPAFLYLLIILPLLIIWYILRQKKLHTALKVSSTEAFRQAKPGFRQRFRHLLFVLRVIALGLLIVAIARPQSSSSRRSVSTEGIDIVIALDVSTSMLSEDFKPNRLDAAKETAMDFIDNRPDDRIGLVIFAAQAFTQCPITIDHDVLKNLFRDVKTGLIEDGTAIGLGLATAVNRLKDSKAKSKVVILLTDGVNNTGNIAPVTAAEIAATYGIRIYTIGVGTMGNAPYPVQTPFGRQYVNVPVEIDEPLLKNIASSTNGKYFRATNNKALQHIYSEIDKLEKTKIDEAVYSRYTEEFFPWALAAALIFVLELMLRYLAFRTVP